MATTTAAVTLQPRVKNPAFLIPDLMPVLLELGKFAQKGSVPAKTLKVMHLRASQINGCAFCVDMHAKELKKLGEPDERIFAVSTWRDAPYFKEEERAALALTEAATRLNDRADAVPDAVWQEAANYYDEAALATLVLNIALINFWNRMNVTTRQVAGAIPR